MTNMWGDEEFNEKPILFLNIIFKLVFCKKKKLIEMYRFFYNFVNGLCFYALYVINKYNLNIFTDVSYFLDEL